MRNLTVAAAAVAAVVALAVPVAGNAAPMSFAAQLDGLSENPSNASPATGSALVTIDRDAHTMEVEVEFADLLGPNIAAHIHCCVAPPGTAPVATVTPTFTGFPSGTTTGTYQHVFDMTAAGSYRAGFLAGFGGDTALAEDALFDGIEAGQAYLNIHSTVLTGGEIRGFLTPVPEAGTIGLLVVGAGVLFGLRRRRAKAASSQAV